MANARLRQGYGEVSPQCFARGRKRASERLRRSGRMCHNPRAMIRTEFKTGRRWLAVLLALSGCVAGMVAAVAQRAATPAARPGRQGNGATLLPNGWSIAPAGHHIQVGDLPLNMAPSPDGRFLVITNNGWTRPTLTVFDTKNEQVIGRVQLDNAWLGLAWAPDGSRLYSAGAAENTIYEFTWANGALKEAGRITIGPPERRTGGEFLNAGFIGGLAMAPDGWRLYAVHVFGQAVSAIDLQTRQEIKKVSLAAEPYTRVVSADGKTLFVSLWGGSKVLMFAADTLEPLAEIAVGGHPNAMVLSKDGAALVRRVREHERGLGRGCRVATAREQISVALYPNAPVGTTPNSLALSPDGTTMLVANADNNTVAIVDIETPGASEVEGWVPVGWYPTSVPVFARRLALLRAERQGADQRAESARAAARRRAALRAVTPATCCRARCRSCRRRMPRPAPR